MDYRIQGHEPGDKSPRGPLKGSHTLVALALLGLMAITVHEILFLTDHVAQMINPTMTTAKETTWHCSVHDDWETVITSGSDADAVCVEHERTVAKSKLTHIPGRPPAGTTPLR